MYSVHRPAPPLDSAIEMFWYNTSYTVVHRRERALPNGRFQLIIDLSGGFEPLVVGMRSEYTVLETGALQHIMSVVFWPGGYCDQAHLAHEFRDFSGITPGAYLASDRPFVNHVAMD